MNNETKPLLFNINKLSTLKTNPTTLGLFWGKAGTGKSALCGSAGSECLYINIGQGITTLQSPWWRNKYKDRDPMIVDVYERTAINGVVSLPEAFDLVGDIIDHGITKMRDQVKHIALDDITYLTRSGLYKAMYFNKLKGKTETLAKAEDKKNKIDVAIPELGDYGTLADLMNWFLASHTELCRAEGVNLFVAAHEKTLYNPPARMGGEKTVKGYMPAFPGDKYNDSVPGMFDLVWHTEAVGGGQAIKYQARTSGDSSVTCKTRWAGIFKELEVDIDLLDVVRRIEEGLKSGKAIDMKGNEIK